MTDWPVIRGDVAGTGCIVDRIDPPLRVRWSFEVGATGANPIIARNRVLIRHNDLWCLSLNEGRELWRFDYGGRSRDFAPAVRGELVFMDLSPERLVWLNWDGTIFNEVPSPSGEIVCPPNAPSLSAEQRVLGTLPFSWVFCLDDSLRYRWNLNFGEKHINLLNYCGNTIVFTESLLVIAVDAETGQKIWELPVLHDSRHSPYSFMCFDGQHVFMTGERHLWKVDVSSGEIVAERDNFPGPINNGCMALAPEGLYIHANRLYRVSRDDLSVLERGDTSQSTGSGIAVTANTVYVTGSLSPQVYQFDRWTCRRIKEGAPIFGDFVKCMPAVANGKLVVTSLDGYVYCLEEEPGVPRLNPSLRDTSLREAVQGGKQS